MNKPIIITVSAKAQHGKDSFANAFIEKANNLHYRTLIIHYGDILKYVCKQYFGWNGEKDEAGRHMLQQIGTNLCRKNNQNVWTNCVIELVKALRTEYDFVVIPDTRFENEIECWEDTEFFVYTVRLNRYNEDGTEYDNGLTEEQKRHPSETSLDDWKFNYVVENTNLGDIEFAAERILTDIIDINKD